MSNGGNGNGEIPDSPTVTERLSTARRASVDGIEVSFDSLSEFILAKKFENGDKALASSTGAFGTLCREIAVPPSAEIAILQGSTTVEEGTQVDLEALTADTGPFDVVSSAWVVRRDGAEFATGALDLFSFIPTDEGLYEVTLSASDGTDTTETSLTITVLNAAYP